MPLVPPTLRCRHSLWRWSDRNFNWDERRQIRCGRNYCTGKGCGGWRWWGEWKFKVKKKFFNEFAAQKNILISFPSIETDDNELRILNKNYDRLAKIYVAQYYMLFDMPSKRLSLVSLFHSEDSFLSFEGEKYRGTKRILEKFEKLKLGEIKRTIKSVDSQPLSDGKIIVNVIGKVLVNNEPSRLYTQTFIFKPQKGSFFLQHDIFRTIQEN